MPYKIIPVGNDQYSVINSKTGKIHSSHSTFENANAQLRLLNGVMHGWVPQMRIIPRVIGQHSNYNYKRDRHESIMTR